MPGSRSIVTKLVLVITLSSAVIFAVTLGYNYRSSRAMLGPSGPSRWST